MVSLRFIKCIVLLNMLFLITLSTVVFAEELAPPVQPPEKIMEKEKIFDGIGIIDLYGDSLIKISGKDFVMNSTYRTQYFGGGEKRPDTLKIGQFVGYVLCENKKICEIWVIKPEDKSKALELFEKQKASISK